MTVTANDLPAILAAHRRWLCDEEGGVRADLTGADLTVANLIGANLTVAKLTGANLTGATFVYAQTMRAMEEPTRGGIGQSREWKDRQ